MQTDQISNKSSRDSDNSEEDGDGFKVVNYKNKKLIKLETIMIIHPCLVQIPTLSPWTVHPLPQ